MLLMEKVSFTRFGEPRVKVRDDTFSIDLTPKCNFGCSFCFIEGRERGKEISLAEFKKIITDIAALGKEHGKKYSVCVAGGEPFLHKDITRILSFATSTLGRDHVRVTTNFSKFPTTKEGVVHLLSKCGYPGLNLSIDRTHLKFDPLAAERLSAIFGATKELGTRVSVISVAKFARESKYRFPQHITKIIPQELQERIAKDSDVGCGDIAVGSGVREKDCRHSAVVCVYQQRRWQARHAHAVAR